MFIDMIFFHRNDIFMFFNNFANDEIIFSIFFDLSLYDAIRDMIDFVFIFFAIDVKFDRTSKRIRVFLTISDFDCLIAFRKSFS